MQEYRKCILDVLQGAISIDHVYNPLLKMSATSSPRNQNNKFRGKCSVSDHLWSSHLTKMTKAKVWVYFLRFDKQNHSRYVFYNPTKCTFSRKEE